MAEEKRDFPRTRKIHYSYTEEIQNVGLQVHGYSDGANFKKLRDSTLDSNLINPTMYTQLIGSLMYLMNTKPDICFAVNALSQFMCEPWQIHWTATKHALRYLRGTVGYGLRYDSECDLKLQGFIDSNWAGCTTDRKST